MKNDVSTNWNVHPVTRGGTDEYGRVYQSEEYNREVYTETISKTISKTGSSTQIYHDKNLNDDD